MDAWWDTFDTWEAKARWVIEKIFQTIQHITTQMMEARKS